MRDAWRKWRNPATRTALVLLACASVSACTCRRVVIPDPQIPHKVVERVRVKVWVRVPGSVPAKWSPECVWLEPDWWVASPMLIGSAP